jgi:hypothetical protein
MLIEDVGVTAYVGALPLLKKKEYVEQRRVFWPLKRTHGYGALAALRNGRQGPEAAKRNLAGARQTRRSGDKDQGIERGGKANFVPSDADGIAFRRTPQEVLRIVYLTDQSA